MVYSKATYTTARTGLPKQELEKFELTLLIVDTSKRFCLLFRRRCKRHNKYGAGRL